MSTDKPLKTKVTAFLTSGQTVTFVATELQSSFDSTGKLTGWKYTDTRPATKLQIDQIVGVQLRDL